MPPMFAPMNDSMPEFGNWITDSVFACAYPNSSEELAGLAREGVAKVVNLHTQGHFPEELRAFGLSELHLPTRDFTPPTIADIQRGVEAIAEAEKEGKRVAVHCGAGLGRTGTLVACYLVRGGMPADAAIDHVRHVRPGSVETPAQEAAVREYEEMSRGEKLG